ncbi:transcriptional regulator, TetR family [Schinkia azotoformans MEV2011]|uniref:Transcriptional regulator, TetR family n=1 Tax=Schinkia azotoformans MEV2011 TaxID=1348973 RepID=A0A072NJK3_SCHAZ|nr:TetR/AcrR family transcriptional regulator [Schinkia azotoformans]KEF37889.1 transcriptional regulator, TetR family [Schinkia azotoformans MEV2011]MEC1696571.1 TetR/AcrR family transcriptional regulator [Schinkia azotoformans]MEC1716050.1 TetR/AcrR family transcriptional regulator [Schinkia azotoformans]MEC1725938.1 TetR/AcrR family transcriptional regulator [Schinkia azotoformans]MEC1740521.1 TetR/AcrR family transcriptional regulator [Schinkia azotoformans]
MPKITFFNLAKDKRQLLIEALEQEFSRVPLYNASISNIVKAANIPRGSFYQYFEDKEDAYFFLLKEQILKNKENFILSLQKCDGDLFDTMTELYGLTVRELSKGENINFLKNVFLNMTHEIENKFNEIFHADGDIEHFKKISLLIKRDDLNVANDQELFHLMKIVITITLRNLIEKFAQNLSEKEAMNNYLIEIELLKKGLKKI